MNWKLFEVTPERARETLKRHGFLTEDERTKQDREARADREPLPYVETPPEVKIERLEALHRRLAAVNFYGKPEE